MKYLIKLMKKNSFISALVSDWLQAQVHVVVRMRDCSLVFKVWGRLLSALDVFFLT